MAKVGEAKAQIFYALRGWDFYRHRRRELSVRFRIPDEERGRFDMSYIEIGIRRGRMPFRELPTYDTYQDDPEFKPYPYRVGLYDRAPAPSSLSSRAIVMKLWHIRDGYNTHRFYRLPERAGRLRWDEAASPHYPRGFQFDLLTPRRATLILEACADGLGQVFPFFTDRGNREVIEPVWFAVTPPAKRS